MASDNETTSSKAPSLNDQVSPSSKETSSPIRVDEKNEAAGKGTEASPASAHGEGDVEPQAAPPSPADSRSEEGEARSDDSPDDDGEQNDRRDGHNHNHTTSDAPPLPNEPTPSGGAPPLPTEAPPGQAAAAAESDDGWSAQWDATNQTWYFYNHYTRMSQWDNPRAPSAPAPAHQISQPTSIAGGYNPAIHGSWDPNAAYAQAYKEPDDTPTTSTAAIAADEAEYQADLAMYNAEMDGSDPTAAAEGFGPLAAGGEYSAQAAFNRRTGQTQAGDQNPERHSDASKSYRQMNAYFNVDQAANSHDGRSLKAERRTKQPTRKELVMWKEKRKARKEEKRRAWLRD